MAGESTARQPEDMLDYGRPRAATLTEDHASIPRLGALFTTRGNLNYGLDK